MLHIQKTNKLVLLLLGLVLPILLANTVTAQICDRSDTIENLLLTALNVTDCNSVTASNLNGISGTLNWSNQSITEVSAIDLNNLTNVDKFDFSNNLITTVDINALQGLTATQFDFSDNNISTLPSDIFVAHTNASKITSFDISGSNPIVPQEWIITTASWFERPDGSFSVQLNHPLPQVYVPGVSTRDGAVVTQPAGSDYTTPGYTLGGSTFTWINSNHSIINFYVEEGLSLVFITALSGNIYVPDYGFIGICDYPQPVADAILAAIPTESLCERVTPSQLFAITDDQIDLTGINITTITSTTLDYLTNITALDLSNNTITQLVDGIFNATNPSSISLSSNNISVIEQNALLTSSSPDNNIAYNLSNNAIDSTTLANGFLNQLKSASFPTKQFDLSQNNITTLDPANFDVYASQLNLSSNQIASFPTDAFANMILNGNDFILDLSNNLLTALEDSFIANGTGYKALYLQGNQITTVSNDALAQLTDLTTIDLSDNQITSLPKHLLLSNKNPSSITSFAISGNPVADAGWEITDSSWVSGASNSYNLVINHSLPQDIVISLASSSGTLNTSHIIINQGQTSSSAVLWTPFESTNEVHLQPINNSITVASLSGYINVAEFGTPFVFNANICSRHLTIVALLINATGQSQCADITSEHLLTVTDTLDWSSLNLQQINATDLDYLYGVLDFDLSNNNLTALVNDTFLETSPNSVSLASNNIAAIEQNALLTSSSPDNNVIYDLSNNAITSATLANGFLNQLKSASFPTKQFDLSQNNITTLDQANFDVYASQLNLSSNQIASFPTDAFDNVMLTGNDISLDLSNNLLSALADDFIATGDGLVTLYLRNNTITTVASNAIAQLTDLTTLDLGFNQLTNLSSGFITSANGLEQLYLNDNTISTVASDALTQLTSLSTLDLSGNQLSSLPTGLFDNLNITDIDLSDNQLTTLPLNLLANHSDLVAITNLNISGNALDNNSWEITSAVWHEATDGSFNLQLGHGLPAVSIDIISNTGSVNATTLDVAANSLTSAGSVVWTPNNIGDSVTLAEQVNISQLSGHISLDTYQLNGICDRSPSIAALLLASVNKSDCAKVAIAELLNLPNNLDLRNSSINQLTTTDTLHLTKFSNFDLSNNNLTILNDNVMLQMNPNAISFAHNNISQIQANALVTSSSPQNNANYDLSNNSITSTTLASGFLNALKSESHPDKTIDLSHNNITTLNKDHLSIFAKRLDLSNNQISNFAADTFVNTERFFAEMDLDLSYNNITGFITQTFVGSTYNTIDLSHNQITSLAHRTIFNTNVLHTVDLGYNQISDFSGSNIDRNGSQFNIDLYLVLDGNPLNLKTNNFAGMRLGDLGLNNITATNVPSLTFASADSIRNIYLRNSDIDTLASDAFTNVTSLTRVFLDNNFLVTIPADAFGGGTNLLQLFFGDNQIATLGSGFATQLTKLKTLDLSGNNLVTLQPDSLANLTATEIDFSDNLITSLPINLLINHTNPAAITSFDLSGNPLADAGWEITNASWVEDSSGEITLQLDHALPMNVSINLTSDTGTLSPSTISIAAGSTSSQAVTWTQTVNGSLATIQAVGQVNVTQLSGYINIPSYKSSGICNRAPAIQAFILNYFVTNDCNALTDANLASISEDLLIESVNLTSISAGDLNGLINIDIFYFYDTNLTSVAPNAFAGLTARQFFFTDNPDLTTLPINLLANHTDPSTITNFAVAGTPIATNGWEITNASWVEASNGELTLQLGHALPSDLVINLTSLTGTLSPSTLTVTANSTTSSQAVTWTQTVDGSVATIQAVDQVNVTLLKGYINIPSYESNGICDRTAAVQTAILAALNVSACAQVTYNDLSQYTADNFDLTNLGLTTVNDFDIDYLYNVSAFDLSDNSLTNITNDTFNQVTPSVLINLANNNIAVIEQNALLTSNSPDNNVDYDLSNNAITSTTLSSGFLTPLKSANFPNKSIDLSYNNITTLDNSQLDIRSDNLDLSHNQITNLPDTVFVNTRQVDHDMTIDLSYNQLTSIAAETFFGQTVAQVDLSYNQIDTLATNAVYSGVDLTSLDLGFNLISDFNASSIHQTNNPNVQLDLVLDGNPLVLKANNFAGLELDYVYIRNSNLTTIPADTFATATNINRIFLTSTNLTALETGSFSSVSGLDYLYLNNNQITTIAVDAFGTISSLTRIYLGDNNLTAVPENAFSNLTNLQTLSINSNQLTAVPVNTLGNNASLITFRLQDNNIANLSGISFSEYTALTQLDLGANEITTLTADNFKGMTATSIGLYNNQLSSLPLNLLLEHNNPASITAFDLSGNPVADTLWQITPASWQENADGSVALYLEHSLPQDISFDVTSTTGNLNATTLTITAGSTSSQAAQWSATSAGTIAQIQAVNSQVAVPALSGYITVPEYEFNGICARDQAIVTAVLNALNIGNCQLVTVPDLSNLTNLLNVTAQGINQLTIDDLNGLLAVPTFDLSDNNLSNLVTDTFINTDPDSIILANNNIAVIEQNALLTNSSPNNNVDYDLSNNAITSATLGSGFLNSLKSANFPSKSIDLSYNNITTLNNSQLDIRADNLNLSHNQITNLPATVFFNTRQSGHDMAIDLSYNQLTSIAAETFFGETVAQVDLSYNQIDTLATNFVRYGEDLTSLDLGYNLISDFNSSSIHQNRFNLNVQLNLTLDGNPLVLKANNFSGLDLEDLYLRSVILNTVPAGTFAGVTHIDRIFLTDTNLTTLAAGSFSAAPGLDELYLNNNVIPTIPSDAFGALTDLTHLDLANNQLSTIGLNAFSQLTNLQTLDLANNAFTTVPTDIFSSNNALQDLFLANNIISTVADSAFSNYTALVGLDLSSNALTSLSVNALQGLTATSIDLSDNQISVLPTNLLLNHTNPANITSFDLSGNLISSWEITQADWVLLSNTQVQLTIPHALPQAITVSFASPTGTLNASEVTILAGETSSEEVTWTGDAGSSLEIVPTNAQVSVAILSGYVRLNSISDLPTFGIAIGTQTVIAGHALTALQLPLPSGGNAPFTYTLLSSDGSALPGNLIFNADNRQLNGTIAATGSYSLTYTATDADSDTANITFLLEVVDNLVPQFTATDALNFAILQNEPTNITLPGASAGNGVVLYTIDTDLPTGLNFNANTRTITGSSSVLGNHTFTYTATDSLDDNGDSLNVTISITPQLQPEFAASEIFNNITMRQDDANFQLQLPAASGGNGVLSYSFTTNGTAGLPAGLFFDEATVSIQGTPQVTGDFNITVLVDDADITVINDSASFSFALTLVASLGFVSEVPANFLAQVGQPASFLLPEGTGGVLPYTYSLDGTLPAGLSFANSTRILSGTPTSAGNFDLSYQVTDADNVTFVATTQLLTTSTEAPVFLSSINDIEIQLGQSINVTLPAVTTDGLLSITYSITGLPAGISFNAANRKLTGDPTELGTHTITYKATDPTQQQVEQSFDITVTTNTAVLQDIMWRQALAIADQTVNSVKKRFALVNQHRLPYVENANGIGANFQVTETNWLGLWLNSGSGNLANQDSSYSWDGSTGVTQIGVDFSGKDYLVGLTSESVSTSSSFTVTGDAFDYTGNLDVSGLGLLSFYGGYYQPKYSVWAITSSGSGSADLSITAEGESSTLSSGVDYSMLAVGGSYKIDDIFDVGFEGITSAALDFSDNTISSVSSNAASRNKFFGSIDFGKWTNKSASKSTAKSFSWSPKLALALRSDSGEGSSSSGLETTASVQLEYSMLNFEFGTRNFSSGDFSESGQWLSFNLIPTGKTGLNFTHRQQFGNSGSAENALLSDAALTDIVAGMRQDDTVTSISTISYGWNIKAGSLQLYSKGESSYADSTATSIFDTKSDIQWEHIGLSFDSASSKYSWNAEADPTAISFKAKIRF